MTDVSTKQYGDQLKTSIDLTSCCVRSTPIAAPRPGLVVAAQTEIADQMAI
ncbi:hypothetical protein [Rhodopseudomonas palustris]|uniref:hypothetical protein n=1 Tax=Rhodopseudomonas palustris TaxID=1076 RepID=UPI0014020C02|nr:hypothetical protein [Rhodopseudomonas palustris]